MVRLTASRSISRRHRPARQIALGAAKRQAGFTLIELLVAVALVMLMMSLFTQIFTMATGSLGTQKGIAENDQRERTLDNLLRADLDKRTFRKIYPFIRQQGTSTANYNLAPYGSQDLADRQGYVHISEGYTQDDTDDIIQFTVNAANDLRNQDATRFGGRAARLGAAGAIRNNPNQPVYDDARIGSGQSDRASESSLAEVVYFVRRGVLYRRLLLIRQPLQDTYNTQPSAGSNGTGADLIGDGYDSGDLLPAELTAAVPASVNFLNDFDNSAHFVPGGVTASAADSVAFHGVVAGSSVLENNPTAAGLTPLGVPNFRFGFDLNSGMPVSYAAAATLPDGTASTAPFARFFGRFTHAETSFKASGVAAATFDTTYNMFGYPGVLGRGTDGKWGTADDSNPLRRAGSGTTGFRLNQRNTLENISNGTEFRGPRAGEDILLTNVIAFDIKVFDDHPQVQAFVDLGHATNVGGSLVGFYGHSNNANPGFGPLTIGNGADGQPGVASLDDDQNGTTDDASELGWPGSDDQYNRCFDTWHASMPVPGGGLVSAPAGQAPFRPVLPFYDYGKDGDPGFAAAINADENGDGINDQPYNTTPPFPANGYGQYGNRWDALWPGSDDIAVDVGPDGLAGIAGRDDDRNGFTDVEPGTFPSWHPLNGLTNPRAGFPDRGELGAPGSDDRVIGVRPMRAIQIRIRYRDESSGQIRDVTIRHAVLDSLPLI